MKKQKKYKKEDYLYVPGEKWGCEDCCFNSSGVCAVMFDRGFDCYGGHFIKKDKDGKKES